MKNLIFIFFLLFSKFSFSLSISEIDISGERIENCKLSTESLNAAFNAAARYNRVAIKSGSTVGLYHQVNALPTSNFSCAANMYFDISFYDFASISGKRVFVKKILCSRSVLLTGENIDIQTRINNAAKDIFDECIADIQKR